MTPSRDSDPVSNVLQPLLQRQLQRLRRRYLLHGLGKTLLLVAALVALFFVLDQWLRLPTPIRLFHTFVVLAALGFGVLRFVRYPLSRRFTDVDLALWLEHRHPELHQRLVSAIQLRAAANGDGSLRNQSAAMIDRLWADTASTVATLRLDDLFDARRTVRVAGGGGLLAGLLLLGALLAPATAHVFVLRHLGFAVGYPRATTLVVELPPSGPDLQRTDRGDTTELVLPAGADLHVSVLATGVVPKEVFLDVAALDDTAVAAPPRSVPMTPRPNDRFRHVFRRLTGSFTFHARGGDDDQGDRTVVVRTIRPAQVATLAANVTPPAYTGLGVVEQTGGAIEALRGSEVELTVTTTALVREATMVFLESGRRIELAPTRLQDDSATALGFRGNFVVDASDRYQIELIADNGLRNPNPGTYPISALQDFAPTGRWLLPEDDSLSLLPNALLCVRVEGRDDFGLVAMQLGIERSGEGVRSLDLLAERAEPVSGPGPIARIEQAVRTELLELADLLGAAADQTGVVLQLSLRDNHVPEPLATELPRRIVQVVDAPQLAALVARSFRSLREDVEQAAALQADRRARLEDLLAEQDASLDTTQQVLTGVAVGQGRVAQSAARVHRGLMRAFDLHLWNRLEPSQHAATVIELYRAHARSLVEPVAHDPAFYRDLAARRAAGTLGALETALDPILAMVTIADRLANELSPQLARTLAEAGVARGAAERAPLLRLALEQQAAAANALADLLRRLEEWNDYQDLVQEVRALRDRQRDLQNRTEEARGK